MISATRQPARGTAAPRCPVCEAASPSQEFTKDGVLYRRCGVCDLAFADGAANANFETSIDDYPLAYLQYLEADLADERNHAALVADVAAAGGVLDAGPVLDVGCGGGKLVRFLRARGIEAFGVEPADAVFGRFLAGDPYFFQSVDDAAAAAGGPFSVVLAVDVLEHVGDPVAFLGALRAAAAADGRVIVSTPDAGSLVARALGLRWHHYNRFHLSLFTQRSLARAAARAGLRVGSVGHPGRYRSVGYVLRYLFEFGLHRRPPRWLAGLDRRFFSVNPRDTMLASLEPVPGGA